MDMGTNSTLFNKDVKDAAEPEKHKILVEGLRKKKIAEILSENSGR